MKLISGLLVFVWMGCAGLYGQEVPPAFEKKGEGKAEQEEELIDPFDPAMNAPRLIRVQVEFIEMAHKDLTRMMMEDKAETSDSTALRMKVQEMVDQDKANILDTQMVVGKSGQKSTSESRSEFVYPTEYDPISNVEKTIEKMKKDGKFPVTCMNPTAFEARNLGGSLESEPTLGLDEKTVDLRVLPSITWHTGDTVWSETKDALGNTHKVSMPEFYVMDLNTSITCISGKYCLVGAASPKDGRGRMDMEKKVMVFVKCNVLPVIP